MADLVGEVAGLVHQVAVLQEENALLRERLALAERTMLGVELLPPGFGLTGMEARVLRVLRTRGAATKEQILDAAWSTALEQDLPDPKIVDVAICKIRKKLSPWGVKITTLWGAGYQLGPDARVALETAIEALGGPVRTGAPLEAHRHG